MRMTSGKYLSEVKRMRSVSAIAKRYLSCLVQSRSKNRRNSNCLRSHKKVFPNCYLQTFDLIDSKTGRLTDLFKVNSLVRVGHLVGDKGVDEEKAGGECSDGGVALRCTWPRRRRRRVDPPPTS